MNSMQKAKSMIATLSFEECITLYEKLPKGNPMIDLVFDRMEELDVDRFDAWLDA